MGGKQPPSWFMLAAAVIALPIVATAQVTTEQSASIIVFPKVVTDGTWDTVIQLGNQSNNQRFHLSRGGDGHLDGPFAHHSAER